MPTSLAITNGYLDIPTFKSIYFPATSRGDTASDTLLAIVINAVSREIDDTCKRRFFQGSAGELRYFTMADRLMTFIDDVVTITEVATDDIGDRTYSNVWAGTDWEYFPRNAAAHGKPYTAIQVTPNGTNMFPIYYNSVRVKATYGWAAVPSVVVEACVIQCGRLWKRPDAIFGVMGASEMGQMMVIPKLDPDVVNMLAGVTRRN